MKSVIVFVLGVLIGSAYPNIFKDVKSAFVESGARDSVIKTLRDVK